VKPFAHCIGCGWELIKDHQSRPQKYQCENRYCKEDFFNDIDKWAFRSEAWKECNFKHVNLTEIHRQSDKMFISILNKIRTGMYAPVPLLGAYSLFDTALELDQV
jgi:ATP-dependent DNA helicase PIF1